MCKDTVGTEAFRGDITDMGDVDITAIAGRAADTGNRHIAPGTDRTGTTDTATAADRLRHDAVSTVTGGVDRAGIGDVDIATITGCATPATDIQRQGRVLETVEQLVEFGQVCRRLDCSAKSRPAVIAVIIIGCTTNAAATTDGLGEDTVRIGSVSGHRTAIVDGDIATVTGCTASTTNRDIASQAGTADTTAATNGLGEDAVAAACIIREDHAAIGDDNIAAITRCATGTTDIDRRCAVFIVGDEAKPGFDQLAGLGHQPAFTTTATDGLGEDTVRHFAADAD